MSYWGQGLQDAVTSVYLMVGGVRDGVCVWKQVPWIISDSRVSSIFTWILMASLGMVLALWLLLDKVVDPLTSCMPDILSAYVMGSKDRDEVDLEMSWKALMNLALLMPVLSICSKATNKWYQKLSDCVFIAAKKLDADRIVTPQTPGDTNYCDTMSLVSTIYTNIIVALLPLIIDMIDYVLTKTLGLVLPRTMHLLIDLARKFITYMGLFYQCLLYGWLPYNFHWITAGVGPGTRFDIVERRWEYFVGFGLPVVLCMRALTWMPLSFGAYFLFMPFMVVASNTTEYSRGYKYLAAKVEYITSHNFDPNKLVGLEKLFAVFLHKTESSHRLDVRSVDPKRKGRPATRFHLGRYYARVRAFRWPNITTLYLMKLISLEGHDTEGPATPNTPSSPDSSSKKKMA